MPGIYVAAAITTLAVIAFYGSLLLRRADADERRGMLLAFAIALPLQPLAFCFVRMPLHGVLLNTLGPGALLSTVALFYAPLTEEPAKWLVLLARPVRRRMTPANALAFALAAGLGFGIGEIWFIAHQLSYSAGIAALPFYAFGGFFGERFVVCFLHGAFVSFAFQRFAERRAFLPGGLIGMALHFALNLPIFLGAIDLFGIGRPAWQFITLGWIVAMTAGLAMRLICRPKGPRGASASPESAIRLDRGGARP
jgi:hypothetical protein